VVISMLDAEPGDQPTTLLRRFLSERQDLLRDRNVIVFAFSAPYYLDATDISKLTAYYCLYGRSEPFVEIAARLLFQEVSAMGELPVSVSGIGYDLFSVTTPEPNQIIELYLDLPGAADSGSPQVLQPTATSAFLVGDTVGVRTGVILDHNGHPVPDGTGVQFAVTSTGEGGIIQEFLGTTVDGIAHISFKIDRRGLLEVRAVSEPAKTSVVLQLSVSGEGLSVTVVAPTPILGATPTPGPPAGEHNPNGSSLEQGHPGFGSWLVMVLLAAALAFVAFRLGSHRNSIRWGVRWSLCTAVGALAAYAIMSMRIPALAAFLRQSGLWGLVGILVLGAAAGMGGGYAWLRLRERTS
jgi:beta-N-acetylhexosaminidase